MPGEGSDQSSWSRTSLDWPKRRLTSVSISLLARLLIGPEYA